MAFTLNPEAQSVFFAKVFGSNHDITVKSKALVAVGMTFELAMYTVKAQFKGKQYSVGTTKGTTSLMKHVVEFPVAEQNKKLIAEWIDALHTKFVAPTHVAQVPVEPPSDPTVAILQGVQHPLPNMLLLIKAVQTVTGMGLADAKKAAESAVAGSPVVLKSFQSMGEAQVAKKMLEDAGGVVQFQGAIPVEAVMDWAKQAPKVPGPVTGGLTDPPTAAKPVDAVVDLKQANALGQKVHGTSPGSVYHCIAFSEHVKVAARLYKGGSISIRAEWTDNPKSELQKLQEAGLQMKSNYGSIHFDAADVPLQRVIGAFLVGTGIQWKAAVMNGAELVIGDKW